MKKLGLFFLLPLLLSAALHAQGAGAALDTTVIEPVPNHDNETQPAPAAPQRELRDGFGLAANQDELYQEPIPDSALAVYIDIEEAFNKHPVTLRARRDMRLQLEAKQMEFVQMQEQLKELRAKEENLDQETMHYKPFYQPLRYVQAPGANSYPQITEDKTEDILNLLTLSSSDLRVASPQNPPQKLDEIAEQLKQTKAAIIEKETFLLNYKELSTEEVKSRQDYIIRSVLKEIYSGIKEYCEIRNIGLVVDKQNLIYGNPLNVTPEFIKWMKSYHKKYEDANGEIL